MHACIGSLNLNLTRVHVRACGVSDGLNPQMAITGVEGNMKYAATCLERERQEEALLAKQVLGRGERTRQVVSSSSDDE